MSSETLTDGNWEAWLKFFLKGVAEVSDAAIQPDAKQVEPRYLAYFMRSPAFLHRAIELTHNLLLPRLRTAMLEGIEMPLPPLPEQRRIVGYLDGLAGLVAALALLPSILDKAFKGEL